MRSGKFVLVDLYPSKDLIIFDAGLGGYVQNGYYLHGCMKGKKYRGRRQSNSKGSS